MNARGIPGPPRAIIAESKEPGFGSIGSPTNVSLARVR
jgi:hypothetical protein